MKSSPVFLDIDTQADFMLASGALSVPGAEGIIPNLKRLLKYARKHEIPVLSSADAHTPDDPSFAEWPPHCVIGTTGQRRIPETLLSRALIVPNRPGVFTPPANWPGQTILEKTEYDVTTNPNFDAVLSSLGATFGPVRFEVFGVATEYCVRGSALSLLRRGFPVDIVTDAIKAITETAGRKAIEEMTAAGARLVTTAEACSEVKYGHWARTKTK